MAEPGTSKLAKGIWTRLAGAVRRRTQTDSITLWPPSPSAESEVVRLDSFNESEFRFRLTDLYRSVCEAWQGQRLTELDADVTIDLLAAWTAKPASAPAPLQVAPSALRARIEEADLGSAYEHVTVSLDGGDRDGVPALQYWTLERGRGAAVRGRTCPDCGAALALDLRGRCHACGSLIALARLAWVLARVESAVDWSRRELDPDQHGLEALDAIAAADRLFDADAFSDRVLQVYPHLAQAIRDPSSDFARVAISSALRHELESMEVARRRLDRRALVDSVSVSGVAIRSAAHGLDRDTITVDVSGLAAMYEVDASGNLVVGDRTPHAIHDRWTFSRPVGTETSEHGGPLAEVCPLCGAPIELDERGHCRHCGGEITLGTQGWMLTEIAQWMDSDRVRLDDPAAD